MNTKLLLVSLSMALSAISMPVMAQGTLRKSIFRTLNKRLLLETIVSISTMKADLRGRQNLEKAKLSELAKSHSCRKTRIKR